MISFEQAKQIAMEKNKPRQESWRKGISGDDFVLESVFEFDEGWLFYFTSEKWLQTKDLQYRPIGGGPIIVGKDNGDFLLTGSGWTQEEYQKMFFEHLLKKSKL